MLRIAFYREKTNCLGPYTRFALWVQGCNRNCKGCVALSHKSVEGGYEISEEVLSEIILKQEECEGITISGGEPMLQAEALTKLILLIRRKRKDYGVIVYTGYSYQKLKELSQNDERIELFLNVIDILIDGEYIEELNDDNGYVGSNNQKIIKLSNRYNDVCQDYYSKNGRKSEFVFEDNKTYLVGIPSKSTLKIWKKIKERIKNE